MESVFIQESKTKLIFSWGFILLFLIMVVFYGFFEWNTLSGYLLKGSIIICSFVLIFAILFFINRLKNCDFLYLHEEYIELYKHPYGKIYWQNIKGIRIDKTELLYFIPWYFDIEIKLIDGKSLNYNILHISDNESKQILNFFKHKI